MKKYSFLMILGLVLLLSSAIVAAGSKPEAIAWRTEKPIVIDGDLSEWNRSNPLKLTEEEQLIRDADAWGGTIDSSGDFYLMWDEQNLFIAAEITEDTPFGATPMLPIDDNDNITIYISTNTAADPNRTSYGSNDFRIVLVIDNDFWDTAIDRSMVADQKGFWSIGMEGGEDVIKGYQRAGKLTEKGLIYEATIPWENLSNAKIPVFSPKKETSVSFNIVLTDISYPCPGTEYIPQIAWTGDSTLKENPSLWGVLIFR